MKIESVGSELRKIRKEKGFRITDVADKLGINEKQLRRYEKDETLLNNRDVFEKLCEIYYVPYTMKVLLARKISEQAKDTVVSFYLEQVERQLEMMKILSNYRSEIDE